MTAKSEAASSISDPRHLASLNPNIPKYSIYHVKRATGSIACGGGLWGRISLCNMLLNNEILGSDGYSHQLVEFQLITDIVVADGPDIGPDVARLGSGGTPAPSASEQPLDERLT